jgi:hypothetical protein
MNQSLKLLSYNAYRYLTSVTWIWANPNWDSSNKFDISMIVSIYSQVVLYDTDFSCGKFIDTKSDNSIYWNQCFWASPMP